MTALPQRLGAAFAQAGAAGWTSVTYAALAEGMTPAARARAEALCPHPAAVVVAAFPYFDGDRPGNLSLYARGQDYHRVLHHRLHTICDFLRNEYPEYSYFPAADASPLPERQAAWLGGLGLRGRNGLLLLPPYGSYVFLGTILTDGPFAPRAGGMASACIGCNRCVAACPTGAITQKGVCPPRCLSDVTQRRGALTPADQALLARHPYVWGCDLCQTVCPYNAAPVRSDIPEFSSSLTTLTEDMLAGLTNRAFAAQYGGRAFAWRGPGVLRRNLALQAKPPASPPLV